MIRPIEQPKTLQQALDESQYRVEDLMKVVRGKLVLLSHDEKKGWSVKEFRGLRRLFQQLKRNRSVKKLLGKLNRDLGELDQKQVKALKEILERELGEGEIDAPETAEAEFGEAEFTIEGDVESRKLEVEIEEAEAPLSFEAKELEEKKPEAEWVAEEGEPQEAREIHEVIEELKPLEKMTPEEVEVEPTPEEEAKLEPELEGEREKSSEIEEDTELPSTLSVESEEEPPLEKEESTEPKESAEIEREVPEEAIDVSHAEVEVEVESVEVKEFEETQVAPLATPEKEMEEEKKLEKVSENEEEELSLDEPEGDGGGDEEGEIAPVEEEEVQFGSEESGFEIVENPRYLTPEEVERLKKQSGLLDGVIEDLQKWMDQRWGQPAMLFSKWEIIHPIDEEKKVKTQFDLLLASDCTLYSCLEEIEERGLILLNSARCLKVEADSEELKGLLAEVGDLSKNRQTLNIKVEIRPL